jgi:hypothetical protein
MLGSRLACKCEHQIYLAYPSHFVYAHLRGDKHRGIRGAKMEAESDIIFKGRLKNES